MIAHDRPTVTATVDSPSWPGPTPGVSVVVATYGRRAFLPDLLDRLEGQDLDPADYEIVVVDNGSTDETWDYLRSRAEASTHRMRVLRLSHNQGPAAGRNHGAAQVRSEVIAITDDDCLPTPGWLPAMRDAVLGGADVVQGTVHPDPAGVDGMGPWDHTKEILAPTPFFETCNVAYRTEAFERAGGFDETDPLLHPPNGRAFGEDACLAWAVLDSGGSDGWAPSALVHHRCIASDFGRWLADQRQLEGFPGLAQRTPLLARAFHRGVFLNRRSERFVWAVAGIGLAVATRRPWPVVAALPWVRHRLPAARRHGADVSEIAELLARYAVSDWVALVAMLRGSVRYRRLLL